MYASSKLDKRSKGSTSEEVHESSSYDSTHSGATKTLDHRQLVVKPVAIALMISIGIGLHNFGEGLAIGASVVLGELALSTFLIVGFMIHNTTEGFAKIGRASCRERV